MIDFSENLQIPIQREPQSMYWVRKAVSILCDLSEIGKFGKIYHGILSNDRNHDQSYTYEGIKMVVNSSPMQNNILLRSDNATHFKCAECFADLQALSDEETIVRVYGMAGHGKDELIVWEDI